jgi:HAD superfamily hydrolase (TIGR01509 family)
MRVVEPVVSIFDVEGTLMDSVPLQLESWRATLNAGGHTFSWADLQAFSGMDGTWMLDQLLPKESQETKHRLLKAQGDCYRTHFLSRARPFPGVRRLFERLKQRDILIGIATTCQEEELVAYDKQLGVLDITDALACGEMVKHGKPDPSLFRKCLAKLQVADSSCAVSIGDTPYDARAAKQLGMFAAGVITGGFSEQALRESGCDCVFEHVLAVDAIWSRGRHEQQVQSAAGHPGADPAHGQT